MYACHVHILQKPFIYYRYAQLEIYVTGSANTLHSHTSDFTTLINHNFKSTNDNTLLFLDSIEMYNKKICGVIFKLVRVPQVTLYQTKNWMCVSGGFLQSQSHTYISKNGKFTAFYGYIRLCSLLIMSLVGAQCSQLGKHTPACFTV